MSDDPYTPFYPGDQWVDWVGLNVYHMGQVSHPCWHCMLTRNHTTQHLNDCHAFPF